MHRKKNIPLWSLKALSSTGLSFLIKGHFSGFQGGQHILNLVDFYGGGFMIFAFAILEVIAIAWIYRLSRVIPDIKFMLGVELGIYWKFCWGLLIPVALGFFFFYSTATAEPLKYGGVDYPDIAICNAI